MAQQTFTLDEEMSAMVELCDRLKVVHKIEIYNEGSGYEQAFLISDPSRTPNWIRVVTLTLLVDLIAERKLAQKR